MAKTIHLVSAPGLVLIAYTRPDLAHRHALCISGADVVACELRDDLDPAIARDLEVAEFQEDDMTPKVVALDDIDDVDTKPIRGPRSC